MRHRYDIHSGLEKVKTKTTMAFSILGVMVLGIGTGAGLIPALVGAAPQTVVYNNIPSPQPGNVVSLGYEATSVSEFGGQVQLAGTQRQDPTVTVLMSSWACKSGTWNGDNCVTNPGSTFSQPITLNIYAVNTDNTPGSLLKTTTQTFAIPYRPTMDDGTNCNAANGFAGEWYSTTDKSCYNGFATPISFNLTGFTLPNDVIASVAYNTSDYGAVPYGDATACHATPQGCPYDSLNVGLNGPPTVGVDPVPNDAYQSSTWGGEYCDNGTSGTGAFRYDPANATYPNCWTDYQPAISISASGTLVAPPTNKDQCKNNGWKTFNNPAFTSEQQCIDYVQNHQNNGGYGNGNHGHNNDNGHHKGDNGRWYENHNSKGSSYYSFWHR